MHEALSASPVGFVQTVINSVRVLQYVLITLGPASYTDAPTGRSPTVRRKVILPVTKPCAASTQEVLPAPTDALSATHLGSRYVTPTMGKRSVRKCCVPST